MVVSAHVAAATSCGSMRVTRSRPNALTMSSRMPTMLAEANTAPRRSTCRDTGAVRVVTSPEAR